MVKTDSGFPWLPQQIKKNETSSGTNKNFCGRHSYTRYIQAHNEQREDYLLNILK